MKNPDMTSPALTISTPSRSDRISAGRLIVLCPGFEMESSKIASQIWGIAKSLGVNVLLLGLSNDHGEDSRLRRKLIILSASIKDANISAEIMLEHGSDWARQLKKILQPGDVVACYADQRTGILRKPLGQSLKSILNVPIYILRDEVDPQPWKEV